MSNTVTYKQKVSISFSPVRENFEGVLSDVYRVFVVKAVPAVPQIAGPKKNRYPLPRVRRLTEDAQSECKENRKRKTGTLAELHTSDANLPSATNRLLLVLLLLHPAWRHRRWWARHPGVWVNDWDGAANSRRCWLVHLHCRRVSGLNVRVRCRVESEGWSDLLRRMLSWRGLWRSTRQGRAIGSRVIRLNLKRIC